MISISPTAAQEVNRIKLSRHQPDSQLRLRIKTGGCSGLFYVLELETNQVSENDCVCESNGITVVIDRQSCFLVEGLKLDYSEDLMGGGFRFQNPNALAICGCGLSFAIDN